MSEYLFCVLIILEKLQHLGEACWNKCINVTTDRAGPCGWCGTEGFCCHQGHDKNGCDSFMGGTKYHECAMKTPG